MTFRVATGQPFPISIDRRTTQFGGETCVVSTWIDLRDGDTQEAVLRKVLENCPAPILMTVADTGKLPFLGPEVDRLFGKVPNTLDFYVNPSDSTGFLDALRREGAVTDHRARFLGADGLPFWGAISGRLIEFDGREVIVSCSRDLTRQLETDVELARFLGADGLPF